MNEEGRRETADSWIDVVGDGFSGLDDAQVSWYALEVGVGKKYVM